MRHSKLTSQLFLNPNDCEDTDEDSKIFSPHPPTSHNAHLASENQDLKNQVELLMRKQKSLLATIRELEKRGGSTESETEVEEAVEDAESSEHIPDEADEDIARKNDEDASERHSNTRR